MKKLLWVLPVTLFPSINAFAQLGDVEVTGQIRAWSTYTEQYDTGVVTYLDDFDADLRFNYDVFGDGRLALELDLVWETTDDETNPLEVETEDFRLRLFDEQFFEFSLIDDEVGLELHDAPIGLNTFFADFRLDDQDRHYALGQVNSTLSIGGNQMDWSLFFADASTDADFLVTPNFNNDYSLSPYFYGYNSPVFEGRDDANAFFGGVTIGRAGNRSQVVGLDIDFLGESGAASGQFRGQIQYGQTKALDAQEVGMRLSLSDIAGITIHNSTAGAIDSKAFSLEFDLLGWNLGYGQAYRSDQDRTAEQYFLFRRFGYFDIQFDYSGSQESAPVLANQNVVKSQVGLRAVYDPGPFSLDFRYYDQDRYNGRNREYFYLRHTQRFAPSAEWFVQLTRFSDILPSGDEYAPFIDQLQAQIRYTF